MIRPILLLALGVLGANSLANLGTTCDVYEQERTNGLCANGADAAKCSEYCKGKFGGELLGAECSDERPNKKRECVCRLKCCNQGCWGDPHCWTCDGVKFGYQGMKKHFMLKPMTDYPNIPYFTISQTNKVYQKGPMAILDVSEVIVKDWKITVELKTPDGPTAGFILKVNEKPEEIPFRWSKLDDNRERFVNIVWGNAAKSQVVLTTSFGLRVVYTTQGAGLDRYTDLSIDTPRHPELKNHMHGLLGRWNDNPDDDSIDATGKKQPLDDGFSWAFGDSWIVPGGRTKTPDCVRDDAVKQKNHHIEEIDPEVKKAAEKLCKDALENPDFKECAKKLRRAVPLLKNCIVDLIFLPNDKSRKKYIDELVGSFRETCKRRAKPQRGGGGGPSSEDEDDGKGGRRPKHPHKKRPDGDDSDEGPHGGGKPKHPNGPGKKPKGPRGDGDDSDEGPHGGKPKHPAGGKKPHRDGPDGDDSDEGPHHGGKPKHPNGPGKKPKGGDGDDSDEGPHGGKPKHPNGPGKKPKGPRGDGDDSDEGPHGGGKPKNPKDGNGPGKKPKGPRGDGDDSDEGPHGGKPKHPNEPGKKPHGPKGGHSGPDSDDSDEHPNKGGKPKHPNGPGKKPNGPKHRHNGPNDSNEGPRKPGDRGCYSKLVPLYRLYRPATDNHFYTVDFQEAWLNAIKNLGYVNEGITGYVAVTPGDCYQDTNPLKPVYRLYKPGAKEDHFYTQNPQEAENAAKNLGYAREGIGFYCPTAKSNCGATVAFQRYFRGTDHFYTPSLEEGNKNVIPHGGKHEGVLCHIWPTPGPVQQ